MDIDERFSIIREKFMEAEVKRRAAKSELGILKDVLKTGKCKSSDEVRDFCAVYFDYLEHFDEETLKPIYELDKNLKNKIGSEVMIVKQNWRKDNGIEYEGESCFPMDTSVLDFLLQYGKLNSDKGLGLDITKGNLIINTGNNLYLKRESLVHISFDFIGMDYNWNLNKGNIIKHHSELQHLYPMPYTIKETEILVGDEVAKWFNYSEHWKGKEAYKLAKELLENKLAA